MLDMIANTPDEIRKMSKKLSKHGDLGFCYEAGWSGYSIHRQLGGARRQVHGGGPSMIPVKPGERIKTDRRDSQKLQILHRSGGLTPVWVPDEAVRDLVRARLDAATHLMKVRQQLLSILLRHCRGYTTCKNWTKKHRQWLAGQTFDLYAHQVVFHDYVEAVWTTQQRRDARIERIEGMTSNRSLGPLVEALRGLGCVDLSTAAKFVATTCDLSRSESPRLRMSYLGLVPSEHSSGSSV